LPLPLAALEASLASSTMPTKLLNHQWHHKAGTPSLLLRYILTHIWH
jgi:hypothetical protein